MSIHEAVRNMNEAERSELLSHLFDFIDSDIDPLDIKETITSWREAYGNEPLKYEGLYAHG